MTKKFTPINWNHIEDQLDKATWEKLTQQFWLDTRIPISNDLKTWNSLKPEERELFNKIFGGLTALDTLQSEVGMASLKADAENQKERAVLNNIEFMESVHAKSYSSIFETLNTNRTIDGIFKWANDDKFLQKKLQIINDFYENDDPVIRKTASVLLETFLFYSGFFTPLYYAGTNKMVNVAEVIKLIIRDESVHGTYVGYKFQLRFRELTEEQQATMIDEIYSLVYELYENEELYVNEVYAGTDLEDDVMAFLQYNANKALMNLGLDPLFPVGADDVNPIVMNGISTTTANHDFFSGVGNGYLLGNVEAMKESDYEF